jgi:transposase
MKIKNWKKFFMKSKIPNHKKYEALRSIAVDGYRITDVAKKFGYTVNALYSIIRDFKAGKLVFFSNMKRGPQNRQTSDDIQRLIIQYRKENLSSKDIQLRLIDIGHKLSTRTVERILKDAGIQKLKRRSFKELGKTSKNTIIPKRSKSLNFRTLKPFRYDCPTIGIFFFIPYIINSGILDILKQCRLPKSLSINSTQACLSMLLLKLIGSERLSHINAYDHEPGFGIFAGLNFLPKNTFMTTYSCRTSEKTLEDFQLHLMKLFQKKYPNFYKSNFINLDFHSIPHFGDQSQMEKVWVGSRGKSMKGAHTIFAQDGDSNAIVYTRADILRKDESSEILKFVDYWKSIRTINETLVFDCKLTTYQILDKLSEDKIQFITLRKRNQNLLEQTERIPEDKWQKMYLPIPKRKHKACKIYVSETILHKKPVKQIIVTHHGRSEPTYIVTNTNLSLKEILIVYAKRWHIENKFSELVAFFNLNALSSPLMVRIHFDILWTVVADTLYHIFAQDLRRFENEKANTLFRKFINMPGQIVYNRKEFTIKIRKRAHTPVLLGVENLQQEFNVPWLDNKLVRIEWTA